MQGLKPRCRGTISFAPTDGLSPLRKLPRPEPWSQFDRLPPLQRAVFESMDLWRYAPGSPGVLVALFLVHHVQQRFARCEALQILYIQRFIARVLSVRPPR